MMNAPGNQINPKLKKSTPYLHRRLRHKDQKLHMRTTAGRWPKLDMPHNMLLGTHSLRGRKDLPKGNCRLLCAPQRNITCFQSNHATAHPLMPLLIPKHPRVAASRVLPSPGSGQPSKKSNSLERNEILKFKI